MSLRIGRLHCRLHVFGDPALAGSVGGPLPRMAAGPFLQALDQESQQRFAIDPTVYIVRTLRVRTALRTGGNVADTGLNRRLGREVARSLQRAIEDPAREQAEVARFADQMEYVARFVGDLLDGTAWQAWYYGPFRRLRDRSRPDALCEVLLAHRDELSGVLARLHHAGRLEALLSALDASALSRLWSEGLRDEAPAEALRPLEDAAFRIADLLGLWRGPRPDRDTFFAAARPRVAVPPDWSDPRSVARATLAILDQWRAAGHLHRPSRSSLDSSLDDALAGNEWLDRDTLREGLHRRFLAAEEASDAGLTAETCNADRPLFAAAVRILEALSDWRFRDRDGPALFLGFARGRSRAINWQDPADLAHGVAEALEFLLRGATRLSLAPRVLADPGSEILRVCGEFDWLDSSRLNRAVHRMLLSAVGPPEEGQETGPTRSRELLADLLAAVRSIRAHLDRRDRSAASNALRLHAALCARDERWSHGAFAADVVRIVLDCWKNIPERSQAEFLQALRQGNMSASLALLPPAHRHAAAPALRAVRSLGEPAVRIVEELAGSAAVRPAQSVEFETRCAGLFLLIRSVMDLQIDRIPAHCRFPTAGDDASTVILASLALCWAGPSASDGDTLDPAVTWFAAGAEPFTLDRLRDAWQQMDDLHHRTFERLLLQRLAARRLLSPERLDLVELVLPNGSRAAVGGNVSARLWPLGRSLDSGTPLSLLREEWRALWQESCGSRPTIGSGGDEQHTCATDELSAVLPPFESASLGPPDAVLAAATLAQSLLRAWSAWLRGLSAAPGSRLLDAFIRRPGHVSIAAGTITVMLDRRPLDAALEVAGYTSELQSVPWLPGKRIRFLLEN